MVLFDFDVLTKGERDCCWAYKVEKKTYRQTNRQAGRGSEGRIADETGRNSVKLQNIYRRKQNAAIVGY